MYQSASSSQMLPTGAAADRDVCLRGPPGVVTWRRAFILVDSMPAGFFTSRMSGIPINSNSRR